MNFCNNSDERTEKMLSTKVFFFDGFFCSFAFIVIYSRELITFEWFRHMQKLEMSITANDVGDGLVDTNWRQRTFWSSDKW